MADMAPHRVAVVVALTAPLLLPACESNNDESSATTLTGEATGRFPDIVDVVATRDADADTWTFRVTVSSPYDTAERYANGWRVIDRDGTVYGQHTLLHDHAAEQPFTRTQTGVVIPDEVDEVIVEGRDLANGYGGATVTVTLDRG